jgi:hypothetical protein
MDQGKLINALPRGRLSGCLDLRRRRIESAPMA